MTAQFVTLDAYAGSVEQRLSAALSDTSLGAGQTILLDRGLTLDFTDLVKWPSAGSLVAANPYTTVDFNGAQIKPLHSGVTFSAKTVNGFRAKNARLIFAHGEVGTGLHSPPREPKVFALGGVSPALENIYAECQWMVADIDGCNGARVQVHALDPAVGGRTIAVGDTTRCNVITLDVFIEAGPGYHNQAACGLLLRDCDVVNISGSILWQFTNILVQPLSGQTASLIFIGQMNIDSAVNGVVFAPAGGAVIRPQLIGGWYGSMSGDAIRFDANAGTIDDVQVVSPVIAGVERGLRTVGSVTNATISDPVVRQFSLYGCDFSTATTGRMRDQVVASTIPGSTAYAGGRTLP